MSQGGEFEFSFARARGLTWSLHLILTTCQSCLTRPFSKEGLGEKEGAGEALALRS